MRSFGLLLILTGALLLYFFAVAGSVGTPSEGYSIWTPFSRLGETFPGSILTFLGSLWTMGTGSYLILRPVQRHSGSNGFVGRILLFNSLLALSAFTVAYTGARSGQESRTIGIFALVGFLHLVMGLLLLWLSSREHPRAVSAVFLGMVLWLGGAVVGILGVAQG